MTNNAHIDADHDTGDGLAFSRSRYRPMAAVLILFALLGAVGCVAADVL
ncbi:hypothetical protein [Conexibacter woesei]|nr:hypothetical protein [Conexibacter woesei]